MTDENYCFDPWTVRALETDDMGHEYWDGEDSINYAEDDETDDNGEDGADIGEVDEDEEEEKSEKNVPTAICQCLLFDSNKTKTEKFDKSLSAPFRIFKLVVLRPLVLKFFLNVIHRLRREHRLTSIA